MSPGDPAGLRGGAARRHAHGTHTQYSSGERAVVFCGGVLVVCSCSINSNTMSERPQQAQQESDVDAELQHSLRRQPSARKLAAFADVRSQMSGHGRLLDERAEAAGGALLALADLLRRRADLEREQARGLAKLARAAPPALPALCAALPATLPAAWRELAADHAALADLYSSRLEPALRRAAADLARCQRRARLLLAERQAEALAALGTAVDAARVRDARAARCRAAAHKLRAAVAAHRDAVATAVAGNKLRRLERELDKRTARYSTARLEARRARADGRLALDAADAALRHYCAEDLADIVRCADAGLQAAVGGVLGRAADAEGRRADLVARAAREVRGAAGAVDVRGDAAAYLARPEFSPPAPPLSARRPPPPLERGEEDRREDEEEDELADELRARLDALEGRVREARERARDADRELAAAERELEELAGSAGDGVVEDERRRGEDRLVAGSRERGAAGGRLARLESRADTLRTLLAHRGGDTPPPHPHHSHRASFSGTLPQDDTLPLVLTSCARVISAYGLRQQGVFRVSGSQSEMNGLRAAFERGEDPLCGARGPGDVHAAAGLLKSFLRGVRPPLLDGPRRRRLLALGGGPGWVRAAAAELCGLSRPALLVLRYVCALLSAVAAQSAHNLMDAHNLAVCVGPALLPAAGPADLHLHNELARRLLQHHRDLFPQDLAPHTLYRAPPAPDLVRDLAPEPADTPEPVHPEQPALPEDPVDSADTFAQHQHTLKKRPRSVDRSSSSSERAAGVPSVPSVPTVPTVPTVPGEVPDEMSELGRHVARLDVRRRSVADSTSSDIPLV